MLMELRAKLEEAKAEKEARLEVVLTQKKKADHLHDVGNHIDSYLNPTYEKTMRMLGDIGKRKNCLLTDSVLLSASLAYLSDVSSKSQRDEIRSKIVGNLKAAGFNSFGSLCELLQLLLDEHINVDSLTEEEYPYDSMNSLLSILNETYLLSAEHLCVKVQELPPSDMEFESANSYPLYDQSTKSEKVVVYKERKILLSNMKCNAEQVRMVLLKSLLPEIYRRLIVISEERKQAGTKKCRIARELESKVMEIKGYSLSELNDIESIVDKFDGLNSLQSEYEKLISQSQVASFLSEALFVVRVHTYFLSCLSP